MLPRPANDPMDRIEPADPIEPIESTDPTDPIERTDPTELIDSTEPRDLIDNTEPLEDPDPDPFRIPQRYGTRTPRAPDSHSRSGCVPLGRASVSHS